MKQLLFTIVLFTFCVSTVSAQLLGKNRLFTYYKMNAIDEHSKSPNFNGIYYRCEGDYAYVLIFYADGTIFLNSAWGTSSDKFCNEKRPFTDDEINKLNRKGRAYWGMYIVRDDTIYYQNKFSIVWDGNYLYQYKGLITDTGITILKEKCLSCTYGSYAYDEMDARKCTFKFYPTIIKPDSSLAWFKKKSWYKKCMNTKR